MTVLFAVAAKEIRYLKTHNAMRGLAALGVFLYHFQLEKAYKIPLGLAAPIVSRGYVWVDFFFVLSGFVLSLNYLESLGHPTARAIRAFYAARVARIVPMHLCALTYLAILVVGFDAGPAVLGRAPFWQFLAEPNYVHLGLQTFLLQIWSYKASLSWNIPSWSISAEMHVYLLMPIMAIALRRAPRLCRALLLALSVAIYLFILLSRPRLDILDPLALLRCLAGFSLGVFLQQSWRTGPRLPYWILSLAQTTLVVVIVAIFLSPLHDVWLIPAFALLIASTATDRGLLAQLLAGDPQQALGHVSYSLYLLNFPVLMTADILWPKVEPVLSWMPSVERRMIWMAFLLLVIVATSRLTFRWLERPLRTLARAFLGAGGSQEPGQATVDETQPSSFPASDPAP